MVCLCGVAFIAVIMVFFRLKWNLREAMPPIFSFTWWPEIGSGLAYTGSLRASYQNFAHCLRPIETSMSHEPSATAPTVIFPRLVVVIPALNPMMALVTLTAGLVERGLTVMIVDDGSTESSSIVLQALQDMPRVLMLHHAMRCGKGAALKTAFHQLVLQQPMVDTVVTATADGRYSAEDILVVANVAAAQRDALVLGVRRRVLEMPFLRRWRKWLLGRLFRLRTGRQLHDPQTGLRGLPRDLMLEALTLQSNGYEFDAALLRRAVALEREVVEVPIDTGYGDGAPVSRFRSWRGGFKVLTRLLGPVDWH